MLVLGPVVPITCVLGQRMPFLLRQRVVLVGDWDAAGLAEGLCKNAVGKGITADVAVISRQHDLVSAGFKPDVRISHADATIALDNCVLISLVDGLALERHRDRTAVAASGVELAPLDLGCRIRAFMGWDLVLGSPTCAIDTARDVSRVKDPGWLLRIVR